MEDSDRRSPLLSSHGRRRKQVMYQCSLTCTSPTYSTYDLVLCSPLFGTDRTSVWRIAGNHDHGPPVLAEPTNPSMERFLVPSIDSTDRPVQTYACFLPDETEAKVLPGLIRSGEVKTRVLMSVGIMKACSSGVQQFECFADRNHRSWPSLTEPLFITL